MNKKYMNVLLKCDYNNRFIIFKNYKTIDELLEHHKLFSGIYYEHATVTVEDNSITISVKSGNRVINTDVTSWSTQITEDWSNYYFDHDKVFFRSTGSLWWKESNQYLPRNSVYGIPLYIQENEVAKYYNINSVSVISN